MNTYKPWRELYGSVVWAEKAKLEDHQDDVAIYKEPDMELQVSVTS